MNSLKLDETQNQIDFDMSFDLSFFKKKNKTKQIDK